MNKITLWLDGRPVTVILVLALLAQLAVAFVFQAPWLTADSDVYIGLSEGLAKGRYGLAETGFAPDVLRPPGYPLILFLFAGMGLSFAAVVTAQLILYAASIWLLVRLAANWGVPRYLLLLLAVGYPFAAFYSAIVGVEGIFIPIFAAIAAILASRKSRSWQWAVAGALSGFAILLRSDMMLLPILCAMLAVVLPALPGSLRSRAASAALLLASAAVVVAPYMAWNHAHFGRWQPSPMAAAVGSSLYTATWQPVIANDDMVALDAGRTTPSAERSGIVAEMARLNRQIGAPAATAPFNPRAYPTREQQIEANRVFGLAALDRIAADPATYAGHVASNLWWLWNTREYPTDNRLIVALLTIFCGAITLFGYAGLAYALARFRKNPAPAAVALLTLYPLLVHLPLHTEARYTAASRLLLLLFAALAICVCVRSVWPRAAIAWEKR